MDEDLNSKISFRKFNNFKSSAIRKRKEIKNDSSDSELESHLSCSLENKNKQKIETCKFIKKNKIFSVYF